MAEKMHDKRYDEEYKEQKMDRFDNKPTTCTDAKSSLLYICPHITMIV